MAEWTDRLACSDEFLPPLSASSGYEGEGLFKI